MSASVSSIVTKRLAIAPDIIEKKVTPIIIRRVQNIYSFIVDTGISPYPTVVIVVIMK
jgi:hypothetical protein